jgi:hypothetical protein
VKAFPWFAAFFGDGAVGWRPPSSKCARGDRRGDGLGVTFRGSMGGVVPPSHLVHLAHPVYRAQPVNPGGPPPPQNSGRSPRQLLIGRMAAPLALC